MILNIMQVSEQVFKTLIAVKSEPYKHTSFCTAASGIIQDLQKGCQATALSGNETTNGSRPRTVCFSIRSIPQPMNRYTCLTLIQQQNKLKVKKDTKQTWTQKQNYNTYTEGVGLLNGGGFFVFASHQWRGCHDISKIRNAVLDTGHTCTGGQYTKHAVHTHQWQGSK